MVSWNLGDFELGNPSWLETVSAIKLWGFVFRMPISMTDPWDERMYMYLHEWLFLNGKNMVNAGEYASPMDASWAKNAIFHGLSIAVFLNPIRTPVGFAELVGGFSPTPLNKNMMVKLDHLPRGRGENKKYLKPPPRCA